jgi:tRNA(Arg) A34 adenosine deaminase TadA
MLLVPYFLWLCLATAINAWIVQFNVPFARITPMEVSAVNHEAHMRAAIEMGRKNLKAPFGSVLVDRRTSGIVASGVNQSTSNPTLHGEIAAINDYAQQGLSEWEELTLYTTAEPCCMCQGAILWAGIGKVVFGSSISQLKTLGWRQIDIPATEIAARSWKRDLPIVGGVCVDECDRLFLDAIGNRD